MPMPPWPRWSRSLYLPLIQKPRHLPWRNWLTWKGVNSPSRVSAAPSFLGWSGRAPACAHLLRIGVENVPFEDAALEHDFEKVIDGGRQSHRRTFRNGRRGRGPGPRRPRCRGEPNHA